MATSENEYYLRSILLLVEGGSYISKLVLYRELSKEDLDELLKRFEHKLRHELHKRQMEKLFVNYGKTNINTWDLQMLIVVILRLFQKSLLPEDRKNLRVLKQIRDEVLAHSCKASLDDLQYDGIKEQLSDALTTLASGFHQDVQRECKTYINKYASGPLDIMSARESLKQLQNNDEKFERILEKVDGMCAGVKDEVKHVGQQMTDFEKNVMERLDRLGLGPCSKKIKVGMTVELTINGPNQEWINLCEEALNALFNGSEETFGDLKKKTDELLEDIKRNSSIKFKGSRKECIILHFECSSYSGILDFIQYVTGRKYRQRLDTLTQTLAECLISDGPVTITSRIPSLCLQSVLDYIEREEGISSTHITSKQDRDLAGTDIRPRKENKKTLKLAMECSSVQDLKYLWRMFQQDGARYYLDRIADALSKQAGTKIVLSSSLDLQEFEEVMNDIETKNLSLLQQIPKKTLKDKQEEKEMLQQTSQKMLEEDINTERAEEKLKQELFLEENVRREIDRRILLLELDEKRHREMRKPWLEIDVKGERERRKLRLELDERREKKERRQLLLKSREEVKKFRPDTVQQKKRDELKQNILEKDERMKREERTQLEQLMFKLGNLKKYIVVENQLVSFVFYECENHDVHKCNIAIINSNDANQLGLFFEDSFEKIKDIFVYTYPLTPLWFLNKWLYHMIVVFQTEHWWWSIEKSSEGITIQKSRYIEHLLKGFRDTSRKYSGTLDKRLHGCSDMVELVLWLLKTGEMKRGYNILTSNCTTFAALVTDHVSAPQSV